MRRFYRHSLAKLALAIAAVTAGLLFRAAPADAACSPPSDFGSVTGISVTAPTTGTYRVWSRMNTPNTSDTYMLEIDGSCYTIGNSGAANTWKWVSSQSNGTTLNLTLSAGAHAVKLYGTSDGVLVDRVILTQDTTAGDNCNPPTGNGDLCADQTDTSLPTGVAITSPTAGATLSGTINVTATASDNVGVTSYTFNVDGVSKGSFTSSGGSNYTFSWNTAGVSDGSHTLTTVAKDAANNTTTSSSVTVTVTNAVSRLLGDANNDGKVSAADFSIINNNWGANPATIDQGDVSGDGKVSAADFSIINNNWGSHL